MGAHECAGEAWVTSPTEISESPPPVPASGCWTGDCTNDVEPSGHRLLALRQKFDPSPVGADTYATDLPSAGTRIDGSAPPPARIIGRLNVACGCDGRATAGNATVTPAVSVAAIRPVSRGRARIGAPVVVDVPHFAARGRRPAQGARRSARSSPSANRRCCPEPGYGSRTSATGSPAATSASYAWS